MVKFLPSEKLTALPLTVHFKKGNCACSTVLHGKQKGTERERLKGTSEGEEQ